MPAPEGLEGYQQQLFEFEAFIGDGHEWMLADPDADTLMAGSAGSESWTCYAPAQAGSDEAGRMGKRGSRRDHHGGGNGEQRAQPA